MSEKWENNIHPLVLHFHIRPHSNIYTHTTRINENEISKYSRNIEGRLFPCIMRI